MVLEGWVAGLPYTADMAPLSTSVLELLVCPVCRQSLRLHDKEGAELVQCTGCRRRYPIVDDIVALIPGRALLQT